MAWTRAGPTRSRTGVALAHGRGGVTRKPDREDIAADLAPEVDDGAEEGAGADARFERGSIDAVRGQLEHLGAKGEVDRSARGEAVVGGRGHRNAVPGNNLDGALARLGDARADDVRVSTKRATKAVRGR